MSDLYNRMKEIEGTYLQPQSFKQYKNVSHIFWNRAVHETLDGFKTYT